MVKINFNQPDGTTTSIDAEPGDSLMTAATGNLVEGIIGDCGGGMSCGTCHVFIDDEWTAVVGPPGVDEAEMLETTAVASNDHSRLGCQVQLGEHLSGLTVSVPERQE